jgi:hypothetical protein
LRFIFPSLRVNHGHGGHESGVRSGVFGGDLSNDNMSAGGRGSSSRENPCFWGRTSKVRPSDGIIIRPQNSLGRFSRATRLRICVWWSGVATEDLIGSKGGAGCDAECRISRHDWLRRLRYLTSPKYTKKGCLIISKLCVASAHLNVLPQSTMSAVVRTCVYSRNV